MTSEPAYLRVAAEIERWCEHQPGGARVWSEHELQEQFGVSRITARAALQDLERRHIVRRRRGSGTFVGRRIPYPIRAGMAPSWTATVEGAGYSVDHQLIEATTHRSRALEARMLLIPRGRSVARITRLGYVDGDVAVHRVSWLPSELVPGITHAIGQRSLTRVVTGQYGLDVRRWRSRAELKRVPADVAEPLELSSHDMAWHIESVNVTRPTATTTDRLATRPIEYTVGWMRADSFRVHLELGPSDDGGFDPGEDT